MKVFPWWMILNNIHYLRVLYWATNKILVQFKWRNGWFYSLTEKAVAQGKPDPCPLHTAWLKELKVIWARIPVMEVTIVEQTRNYQISFFSLCFRLPYSVFMNCICTNQIIIGFTWRAAWDTRNTLVSFSFHFLFTPDYIIIAYFVTAIGKSSTEILHEA